MRILLLFIIIIFSFHLSAQDHFIVELESRSPDVKELVKSYEGFPAIPFLANDLNGDEQSISGYNGKVVFLWFWNTDCIPCKKQATALNLLTQKYASKLQVISFSDDSKAKTQEFLNNTPMDFPVIANSKTLADGPYGGDMGYPRIFIIDQQGIIKWVFPEELMKGDFNTYNILETLLISLYK